MNLLKIIIVIGFGMMLISCGNNDQRAVEVDRIENGVPKTKDGRIILSSESNALIIPSGQFEGVGISSAQLASIIEGEVENISQVYNLSFKAGVSLENLEEKSGGLVTGIQNFITENLPAVNKMIEDSPIEIPFIASFSVSTQSSAVYDGIECFCVISEKSSDFHLELKNCGNDQAVLKKTRILVNMSSIVVDQAQLKTRDVL